MRRLSSQYTTYPRLDGRLVRGADGGVRLTGTAIENGAALFLVSSAAVVAVLMFLVAVTTALTGDLGGVVVGVPAAAVFGWLTRSFHRARRTFAADVDELVAVMQAALRT